MTDWLGLEGRKVVVAGGAGTIGRALVEGFAGVGARVAAIDRSGAPLDELAAETGAAMVEADLREQKAAHTALAQAREAIGGIDVFVHCVGINNRKPIDDYTAAEWDEIIAVNLTSAFATAQAALAPMREQGFGRLIFFSSVAGRSGHRDHGPYAATKAAINQLMRVIANENAPHGVTANAVAPGYMRTALTERYLAEHPDYEKQLIGLIPARRFGELEEVVGPVLFLASQHSSFITGQVLYIDGGRTVV
jgi:NAD(P)-dependent dehydrogenase (short-subunit alcohol dehydrogenase family)